MASGVPASPSGGESAEGRPVEEQTKAQGGDGAGGVEGAPGEVAPTKRAQRQRLPGVMTKDDGEGLFPDLGYKSRTGKKVSRREASEEAEREMREEAGLDLPPPPEEQDPKPKVEAPAPKKVKFADKEYDTMEAAEQSFKSLQGMFKPLQDRVSKAEQLAQEATQRANEWYQEVQKQQGKAPAEQTTQPTTQQAAEKELQAVLQNVDGEMFETLARERGLPLAGRFLAAQVLASVHDHMLPALRQEILDQVMPQLQPIQQSVEFQQQTETVSNLITNMAALKNPDGNIAFPELNDETEMQEVAELWSGMDTAQATPQSLIQALALYRLYRGSRSGSQPTTPSVQVQPPQNTLPRPGDASLEAGGAGARPGAARAGSTGADALFARELDNADLVDRTLGFAVRRRR